MRRLLARLLRRCKRRPPPSGTLYFLIDAHEWFDVEDGR